MRTFFQLKALTSSEITESTDKNNPDEVRSKRPRKALSKPILRFNGYTTLIEKNALCLIIQHNAQRTRPQGTHTTRLLTRKLNVSLPPSFLQHGAPSMGCQSRPPSQQRPSALLRPCHRPGAGLDERLSWLAEAMEFRIRFQLSRPHSTHCHGWRFFSGSGASGEKWKERWNPKEGIGIRHPLELILSQRVACLRLGRKK